jgi:predicted short-subunit dehydrogenase-like oxidoreductase (DUF2520 family)
MGLADCARMARERSCAAGTGRVAQALGRFLIEPGHLSMAIGGRNPERTARAVRFLSAYTAPAKIQDLPAKALIGPIQRGDSAAVMANVKTLKSRSSAVRVPRPKASGRDGPYSQVLIHENRY